MKIISHCGMCYPHGEKKLMNCAKYERVNLNLMELHSSKLVKNSLLLINVDSTLHYL
jgi:hypothetical protein